MLPQSDELISRFELLELEQGDTTTSFRLAARQELCTPFEFLYGGSGIAASIEASERTTGRPLQWITTQFIGSPKPNSIVEVDVNVAATGRSTTQTQVTGHVDGELVLSSLCAHNIRAAGDERAFATMPDVAAPEDCEPLDEIFAGRPTTSFFRHFERLVAAGKLAHEAEGEPQSGVVAMWCRLNEGQIGSPATQAFVSDIGPLAVCAALGSAPGGTSLDNTLRVVDPRPSEWVLLEAVADGFHRSVGHSTVRLWSRDGRLMGIAQQSAIVRTSHHIVPPSS